MSKEFDDLEFSVNNLAQRTEWEVTNRLDLLWGHAFIGIIAGMLMVLTGTPIIFEDFYTFLQYSFSIIPIIGGFVLALGLAKKPRNLKIEALGLTIILIWDLVMVLGVSYYALSDPNGRIFAVAVYGGLAYFMLVHLKSIRKIFLGRQASG